MTMQNMIKLTAFLVTFALSLSSVFAQYDDDIYYSPSAEKKAQEAAVKATMWSTDANNDWDVDGYNRRYSSASTGATSATSSASTSTLTSLNKSDRDTVYIIKENYYSLADLLYRFHGGFYRPSWYWHTAWGWGDPFYWDRWYHDPFYWDSYYYGSWGWSWGWGGIHYAWHRPIYYPHYYGWRPAPHHHYRPIHRAPAHRVGGHSVIGGHGGRVYHSPAIARGGNRHSGIRGGNGSGYNGGSRSGSGIRGGNGRGGSRHEGSRGEASRGGQSQHRYDGGSRNNGSSHNYGGSRSNYGGGGSFGGGRSGGGGGHFGGGGGHSGGGGGGRGRR